MKTFAAAREFEKAAEVKNRIFALGHIRDVSLIKKKRRSAGGGHIIERVSRSEAHRRENVPAAARSIFRNRGLRCSSHPGKESVGVMTVVIDGELAKSEYRKFKLDKSIGNDDTESLAELLRCRANHLRMGIPNMIVIDGERDSWESLESWRMRIFKTRRIGRKLKH